MTTSAQKMRAYEGPLFFARGFRPFFLSAAVFAGIAMPLWVAMLVHDVPVPSYLEGSAWHIHEMIFGYVAAVVVGFLLTAVPNWTGRLPVVGGPLMALWLLWIAGRVAIAFSAFSPLFGAVIDSAFLVVFAGLIWREIASGKNKRNYPVAVLVSLFAFANIAYHYLALNDLDIAPAERAALGVIAILIALIGGRVTPSFTRNWMASKRLSPLPASMGNVDKASMALSVVAVVLWVLLPDHILTAGVMVLAAVSILLRMARWRTFAVAGEAIVVILHIAYLWLAVWFFLMAFSIFSDGALDAASALHALSAGAIGTMTMAMMTRASLGHSGQVIHAGGMIKAIYGSIILGAIIRIFANVLPVDYMQAVGVAGMLYALGMVLFVIYFAPMFIKKNVLRS